VETGVVSDWDVLVVGAGPAGSVAARGCAERGARVLLVDREAFPRWKVCGACLGPGGRHALERARLGGLPERLGGTTLVNLMLTAGERSARIRLNGNMAVSRTALDAALVEEAAAAGVTVRTGVRADADGVASDGARTVHLRERETGRTDGVRATVVIDATGLAGGFDGERPDVRTDARVGVGAVFADAPVDVLPGDLHMIVGPTGYVGLVLDEEARLNVAAAVDRTALADGCIASALAEILEGTDLVGALDAEPVRGWKGTPALTRSRHRLAAPGLFRIGDAGGYVEPFTGEGIGWALSAGVDVVPYAVQALDGWRNEIGDAWHDDQARRMRRTQRFCRWLAGGLRRPRLVRTSVRMFARYPGLAGPLVAAGSTPVPA
jgi:flavin-dependent dehydrogenase